MYNQSMNGGRTFRRKHSLQQLHGHIFEAGLFSRDIFSDPRLQSSVSNSAITATRHAGACWDNFRYTQHSSRKSCPKMHCKTAHHFCTPPLKRKHNTSTSPYCMLQQLPNQTCPLVESIFQRQVLERMSFAESCIEDCLGNYYVDYQTLAHLSYSSCVSGRISLRAQQERNAS